MTKKELLERIESLEKKIDENTLIFPPSEDLMFWRYYWSGQELPIVTALQLLLDYLGLKIKRIPAQSTEYKIIKKEKEK